MEDNKKLNNDDKTRFYNSQDQNNGEKSSLDSNPNKKAVSDDKTQIDMGDISSSSKKNDNNVFSKSTDQEKIETQNQTSLKQASLLNNQSGAKDLKKGFSGAQMAAGVAGAGLAGIALGANFSDEIKETISDIRSTAEDNSLSSTSNVSEPNSSNISGEQGKIDDTSLAPNNDHIEVTYTDNSGNSYCVNLTDLDGDGISDITSGDIHLVDGSSIQFVQHGDSISPLFASTTNFAGIEDYQSYFSVNEPSLYEPSFENEFPIENVLELSSEENQNNPVSLDDNLDELIQEGLDIDFGGDAPGFELTDTEAISVADTSDFQEMDWESFEAEQEIYASTESYDQELSEIDFESYQTPDNYPLSEFEDFGISDFL